MILPLPYQVTQVARFLSYKSILQEMCISRPYCKQKKEIKRSRLRKKIKFNQFFRLHHLVTEKSANVCCCAELRLRGYMSRGREKEKTGRSTSQIEQSPGLEPLEIQQSSIYYTGSVALWEERLIDQASDVPSIIFFHNFLQTQGTQNIFSFL